MLKFEVRFICTGILLQVTLCYRSCIVTGPTAYCSGQQHNWIPTLPPTITHLFLELNHISEINSSSLQDFPYLQQLDLGSQTVPLIIRNNAFLRQRNLVKLVLGSNQNLKLEPRAFAGLFNLKYLFMDYCNLTDTILSENYLEPLISLEALDLFGNNIVNLKPGLFFTRLTQFTQVNLKLNKIQTLCEEDLLGFRGKHFSFFNFQSNKLLKTDDWESCGNPFKEISFGVLDLSSNGLNLNQTTQFFKAIEGTSISHLIYSGYIGKGFSHNNLPDPDASTFQSLKHSRIEFLDLSNNCLFALRTSVFSPLQDVVIIDVSQNSINQINTNAFNGLQDNLRMLNLSWNLLGEVRSHTFANLRELRVLDLSGNHIGVFGYSAFTGLPKLRALYLTGNSLKDLGFPQSLPNLEYLLLGDNKLKSIYQINHLAMSSIHVDVSSNKLTNLEDVYLILAGFSHLQTLFFGGNSIQWCTLNEGAAIPVNHSLKVLDLHSSALQAIWGKGDCLNLFDHLKYLQGLNISLNSLSALPRGIFNGLSSIIEIDLSSNALTHLETDVFPASLQRLDLSNNFLASPDPMAFESVAVLSLSSNPFYCDCNLESFVKWLNTTNVTFLTPAEEYTCEFPATVHDLSLLNYSRIVEPCEQDDEQAVRELKLALFIFTFLLVVALQLGAIIYTRFRGHIFVIYKRAVGRVLEGPKPAPPEGNVQYDAFLCFSNNDYRWVEAALLRKLDNQFSEENVFHCCFEARDFLPGEDHLSNIRDAIWGSRKTLCIVSKEFLKDGWCLEAFTLAQGRMLEELTNVLVMMVVGKVAHYQLMKCKAIRAFVRRREYLIWPEDPQDLEWFYEQLVSQMLKDTKIKKFPENKPEPEEPAVPQNVDAIPLHNINAVAM